MRNLSTILNRGAVLFAGVLAGATLTGCPGPKTIGAETDTSDEQCMEGDMKPAPDGCNTCTCIDGEWGCTEIACGDEAPQPVCEDGEMMDAPDGCNTCSCYQGQWACTQIGCDATEPPPQTSGSTGETGGPVCGDGVVEGDELCDDGNQIDDDACPNDCGGGTSMTTDGTSTGGDTEGDTGPGGACGDGVVGGLEECDDGNLADGDGCSANCTLEGISEACADKPMDPLVIDDAAIDGDTLLVDVSYGGGCEAHAIDYCWDELFAESDPVQTWITLWHDSNDDPCDAIVMEQRVLDLTPMKQAWQAAYQQQSGEIVVHLAGWDQSLNYAF